MWGEEVKKLLTHLLFASSSSPQVTHCIHRFSCCCCCCCFSLSCCVSCVRASGVFHLSPLDTPFIIRTRRKEKKTVKSIAVTRLINSSCRDTLTFLFLFFFFLRTLLPLTSCYCFLVRVSKSVSGVPCETRCNLTLSHSVLPHRREEKRGERERKLTWL